jgi:hypothetical protein
MQASTLLASYALEQSFRNRTKLNLEIQEERHRVAAILSRCFPERLLASGDLHVPLIEQFEDATVMFCRYVCMYVCMYEFVTRAIARVWRPA